MGYRPDQVILIGASCSGHFDDHLSTSGNKIPLIHLEVFEPYGCSRNPNFSCGDDGVFYRILQIMKLEVRRKIFEFIEEQGIKDGG